MGLIKNIQVVLFVLFTNILVAQSVSTSAIKWYSIEEAGVEYKKNAKPFFIDLYTDWCGWCKKMDVGTFQDPVIANYLNTYFYPVKFNAESKDTVDVFGRKFWNSQDAYIAQFVKTSDSTIKILNDSLLWINNKKKEKFQVRIPAINSKIEELTQQKNQMQRQSGRTSHDLARDLMNNQMSYPTFVFLFDSLRQNFPVKGYQQPAQLLSFLSFINEGVYKNTSNFTEYQNLFFQSTNSNTAIKSAIKWKSAAESISKPNVGGKKTLLLITSNNYYSSLTMENGSFNDEQVAYYINQEYIPLKLDINQQETINFKGVDYKNVNGIHELALYLFQNEIYFPMMVILDENYNIVSKIPGFYPPMDMESILAFFKEEVYKKNQSYIDFKKEFEIRTK